MIVGLFLKNIKCYKDVNFIPLTTESPFCGLIGKNGVGKSAVLEALDWVMNDKKNWNLHISCKKNGARSTPHIVPIFCLPKDNIRENIDLFEKASEAFWGADQKSLSSLTENSWKLFSKFRDSLKNVQEETFVVPIGLYINTEKEIVPSSGLFNFGTKAELGKLLKSCQEMYDYIYIPKDIEPDKMMLLQTDELQTAIGKTLEDVIAEIFDSEKIKEISKKLKNFTEDISKQLGTYLFKESGKERQSNLQKEAFYHLIIKDFFSKRRLNKKMGAQTLDISLLSSGEKQQAILDLYAALIKTVRTSDKELVVGIDEPESSLHISACFDQFEKLFNLSSSKCQVIYTAHWYGFIPAMESGSITNFYLIDEDMQRMFYNFDIQKYYEQTSKARKGTIDIELKSINDVVQTLISGAVKKEPYNWIICEGSSDKIYLSHYLSDLLESKKLRIITLRGVTEIQRIYQHLKVIFCDDLMKESVKGKIFLLADTDPHLIINKEEVKKINGLFFKRLSAERECVKLVNADADLVSQADVEMSLNGKILYCTFEALKADYSAISDFLESPVTEETCTIFSFDWKPSNIKKMKEFLASPENKVLVARKYVEILQTLKANGEKTVVPEWIQELRKVW